MANQMRFSKRSFGFSFKAKNTVMKITVTNSANVNYFQRTKTVNQTKVETWDYWLVNFEKHIAGSFEVISCCLKYNI